MPESKRLDGAVAIRCAHGDTMEYPLATVDISVGGQQFTVEAGVADASTCVAGNRCTKPGGVATQ